MRADNQSHREELRADFQSHREEVRADMQIFRQEVRADLAEVNSNVGGLRKDVQATHRRKYATPATEEFLRASKPSELTRLPRRRRH